LRERPAVAGQILGRVLALAVGVAPARHSSVQPNVSQSQSAAAGTSA
jgi:hypothetical protein